MTGSCGGTIGAMETHNVRCKSSRCSAKLVRDVMERLNEKKRKLVESIGFGSLLGFPDIRKINRNLSVWLMERVDVETKTLVIDERKMIQLDVSDVSLVFGIPCSGQKVLGKVPPSKEIKNSIMRSCFGTSQCDQRSVKAAQGTIEKESHGEMTADEQNAFKQCFIMFVMAALLAPGAKHDYACVDYWNAISDPLHIGDYNWSEYVMERLIEGVVKLKSDLACGVKAPKITGCSLFLQVLYLDSIDTGIWNLEHSRFPRINSFTFEHMRGMIASDRGTDNTTAVGHEFGRSQLRSPFEVCYRWATAYKPLGEWADICVQRALWQAAVQMTSMLNVPDEARVTSGSYDMDKHTVQKLSASDHVGCERKKIKMIMFPTILHNRWVCYAWRLKDNTIVVWDPMWASSSTAIRHFHIKMTCALRKSLDTVAAALFPGWDYKWSDSSVEWFNHALSGENWLNRTGVLCAYFCWHFDGVNLRGNYAMDNYDEMTFNVLAAVVDIADPDEMSEHLA